MSFTHQLVLLLLGFIHTVTGRFPHCVLFWEMQRARGECQTQLQQQTPATAGCLGEWNNVSCWRSAAVGEVLTLPCPSPFLLLFGKNGNLSRNCTEKGWSSVYPDISVACSSEITDKPKELVFYRMVQVLSTLGHSLSLITLLTSSVIICLFRRLHCMRNYIHLNLFVSFILRAVAVLIKDTLLFSEDETIDCSTQPSLVGCKASLVFFHYFVMANFFWLLVEGLYLHMLLLVNHTYSTRLSIYMVIGWGIPFIFMVAWIISRINLENTSCWEINDNPVPDRLINWPIMTSVIISFILFISIIRILIQKLRCANVGGNDQSQYRRLAKSTLLLIPLFGVNYVVFCYLMEPADKTLKQIKIFFDLGLGSFQAFLEDIYFLMGIVHAGGFACSVCRVVVTVVALIWVTVEVFTAALWLWCGPWPTLIWVAFCWHGPCDPEWASSWYEQIPKIFLPHSSVKPDGLIVAVLYCFLNSEVQSELRRTWRGLSLKGCVGQDYRLRSMSTNRNGTENSTQFPRNIRAQSILQTETSML